MSSNDTFFAPETRRGMDSLLRQLVLDPNEVVGERQKGMGARAQPITMQIGEGMTMRVTYVTRDNEAPGWLIHLSDAVGSVNEVLPVSISQDPEYLQFMLERMFLELAIGRMVQFDVRELFPKALELSKRMG